MQGSSLFYTQHRQVSRCQDLMNISLLLDTRYQALPWYFSSSLPPPTHIPYTILGISYACPSPTTLVNKHQQDPRPERCVLPSCCAQTLLLVTGPPKCPHPCHHLSNACLSIRISMTPHKGPCTILHLNDHVDNNHAPYIHFASNLVTPPKCARKLGKEPEFIYSILRAHHRIHREK